MKKGQDVGGHGGGQGSSKKVKYNEVDDLSLPTDNDNDDEKEPLEANPFLLNPVLKVMMSQMTIEDLKRSRGVCQLWDEYSTLELQKLTSQMKPQDLTEADLLQKFVNSLENLPNKVLISYKVNTTLEVISSQNQRFYQNFQPKSLKIDTEEEDTNVNSKLLQILQNSSEHIKVLQIKGPLDYRQFGGDIKWSKNFKLPQLEELSITDMISNDDGIKYIQFIMTNVLKNVPKLTSLKLLHHIVEDPVCDLLISNGLIENLHEFGIGLTFFPMDDLTFVQDLLKISQFGLKLTKFEIDLTFVDHIRNEVILDYLDKFREFLTTQSDTLEELKICLDIDNDICKFSMPPLPKLKVLEIKNERYSEVKVIPYEQMDLPSIFPVLKEIIIDFRLQKSDFLYFCDLSKIFSGFLESVEKLTIQHPKGGFKFANYDYAKLSLLETYFPNVVEFDMGHLGAIFNFSHIPWEKNLKKLTLHPPTLENLKFNTLSHLKGLDRLELINETGYCGNPRGFDFKSLSKTTVKSVKIRYYQIREKVVKEIRSRFILDYLP